jgi:DNA-binding GntR family transcriptional regulator
MYAAPDGHRRGDADKGPKYKQVASAIEADIRSGKLAPGMRLLAERVLAEQFEVSYGTVRHAVEELRDAGLVYTTHGEGTFVIGPPEPDAPQPDTSPGE